MVPPGTYQARLQAGEWEETLSFEVVMDPRVSGEGIGGQEVTPQAGLALRVRDLLSSARALVARIAAAEKDSGGELPDEVQAVRAALVTAPVRYSPPMLVDQLQYLYSNLDRADQAPGDDAYARAEELNQELQGHLQRLEGLLDTP